MTTFNSSVRWETAQLLHLAVVLATEPGTTTIRTYLSIYKHTYIHTYILLWISESDPTNAYKHLGPQTVISQNACPGQTHTHVWWDSNFDALEKGTEQISFLMGWPFSLYDTSMHAR